MAKKMQFQDHPKNPANQPFQGTGKRCASKVASWWNPDSKTYFKNLRKKV